MALWRDGGRGGPVRGGRTPRGGRRDGRDLPSGIFLTRGNEEADLRVPRRSAGPRRRQAPPTLRASMPAGPEPEEPPAPARPLPRLSVERVEHPLQRELAIAPPDEVLDEAPVDTARHPHREPPARPDVGRYIEPGVGEERLPPLRLHLHRDAPLALVLLPHGEGLLPRAE